MVGADGNSHYMYTLVLDAESYGVYLYSMCSHILSTNVCFFLQLFRTSSLRREDSQELSGQQ